MAGVDGKGMMAMMAHKDKGSASAEPAPVAENIPQTRKVPETDALQETRTILLVVFCLWILLTFIGNLGLIILVLSKRSLRLRRDYVYVVSALFSGLSIALFVFPADVLAFGAPDVDDPWLTDELCRICVFWQHTSIASNLLTQTAAAVDQWWTMGRDKLPSRKTTMWIVVGIWAASLCYSLWFPLTHGLTEVPGQGGVSCAPRMRHLGFVRYASTFDTLFLYFVPLLVTAVANVASFCKIRKDPKARPEERRMSGLLLVLVILFGTLLAPYTLLNTLVAFEVPIGFASWVSPIVLLESTKALAYAYDWLSIAFFVHFTPELRNVFCRPKAAVRPASSMTG